MTDDATLAALRRGGGIPIGDHALSKPTAAPLDEESAVGKSTDDTLSVPERTTSGDG